MSLSFPNEAFVQLCKNGDTRNILALAPMLQKAGLDLGDDLLVEQVWIDVWFRSIRSGNLIELKQIKDLGIESALLNFVSSEVTSVFAPAIAQALQDGPARFHDALAVSQWDQNMSHALDCLLPIDDDEEKHARYLGWLRQILLLQRWDLAAHFCQSKGLDINNLKLVEGVSLARIPGSEAWDWFLRAGGDPYQKTNDGEPVWIQAARKKISAPYKSRFSLTSFQSLPPSSDALDWGRQHDREAAERLLVLEYFDRLNALRAETTSSGSPPEG